MKAKQTEKAASEAQSHFDAIFEAIARPFKDKVKELIADNVAVIKDNKRFLKRRGESGGLNISAKMTIESRIETLEKQNAKLKAIIK